MQSSEAQTSVELCGKLADLAGFRVCVAMPAQGCSATELLASAARAFPSLAGPVESGRVRVCVNDAIVHGEAQVRPCDRIALFPPVSGG